MTADDALTRWTENQQSGGWGEVRKVHVREVR